MYKFVYVYKVHKGIHAYQENRKTNKNKGNECTRPYMDLYLNSVHEKEKL